MSEQEQVKVVAQPPSFPSTPEDYEVKDMIGKGASATVHSAKIKATGEDVAIKIINLDKFEANIDEITKEIKVMAQCRHENVVTYFTSFIVGHELWLVMKYLGGGSSLDIMRYWAPKGFEEDIIATILKEALKGLEYFHRNGQIHRDVKAGNILLGLDGAVQLADFGVSNWVSDPALKREPRKTFVGTPCWMAPEVMEQKKDGYDVKADIWSFGITALELAQGRAPYAKLPPMKVIMSIINEDPPTLDINSHTSANKYSKIFKKMIDSCLYKDPTKRPSATELLKSPFFNRAKSKEWLVNNLIVKLPPLAQRAANLNSKKVQEQPASLKPEVEKVVQSGDKWNFDDDDSLPVSANRPTRVSFGKEAASMIKKEPSTGGNANGDAQQQEQKKTEEMSNPAPATAENSGDDAVTEGPVLGLKLRLRDQEGVMKDIKFEYHYGQDTPIGIATEMLDAGLISDPDLHAVATNTESLVKEAYKLMATGKTGVGSSVKFGLPSAGNGPTDEANLKGFAQLAIIDFGEEDK
eukprot:Clim_evm43s146 gene=Clim_evmTU43s146